VNRTKQYPIPVRIYRYLARRLLGRRLASVYLEQAVETFTELYRDTGRGRSGGRTGLLFRELRSLLNTAGREGRSARRADRVVVQQQVLTATGDPGWKAEGSPRPGNGGFNGLMADIRHAARGLRLNPAFSLTTMLLLVLGTAGTILAFGAFVTTFIRPAPWLAEPDRVICLFKVEPEGRYLRFSYGDYLDVREGLDDLAELAAVGLIFPFVGSPSGVAEEITAEQVSPGYFRILGIPLALGRGFLEADFASGGQVAIISHRLWEQEYGGAPDVLEATIRLDGLEYGIVGVAPPGLSPLGSNLMRTDAWIPIRPLWRQNRDYESLQIVGRLRPDVELTRVQLQARTLAAGLVENHPIYWTDHRDRERSIEVLTERGARLPPPVRLQVIAESVMVAFFIGLILIVACANVGNLQLARGLARDREIAVRLALGAGRRRLLRLLLTESLMLSLLAVAVSLVLVTGLSWMASRFPGVVDLPAEVRVVPDGRVVLFTIGLALMTTVIAGLVPARQIVRPDLAATLKGHQSGGLRKGRRLRHRFVIAQVAGSLILVILGTLSVRNYQQLRRVDPGLQTEQVALLTLDLSHAGYTESDGRVFAGDLESRLENVPGIEQVAIAFQPAMGPLRRRVTDVVPTGYELPPGESYRCPVTPVGPGYFDLLEIPLLGGRDFNSGDTPASEPVAIINESWAARFFPDEDALGRTISLGASARIVAVVRDTRSVSLAEPPVPQVWVPFDQSFAAGMTFHIRTRPDPRIIVPAIRDLVRAMDDRLPVPEIGLLAELAARETRQARSILLLLNTIALVILLLAMTGLYAVMIFTIGQRRREFGIRMSFGARSRDLIGLVVSEGIGLSLKGAAVGILVILLLTPLLGSFFTGVSAADPLAIGAALIVLLGTALAASLPSAFRATRIDPVEAMRQE